MKRLNIIMVLLSIGLCSSLLKAEEPDWNKYDQLLSKYVKQGQLNNVNLMTVDYIGIKSDKSYQRVVSQIESFDTVKLKTKQEKLAFYINAYNVLAIKMVLDHWPVESIKDIGGLFSPVWKKEAGTINHKTVTLHHVEHEVLRKMNEPRIHMAIVCASVSCPDLRNEAYTAGKIEMQLDEQSKLFLSNNKKGLYIKGNTVYVSKIFDWFEDDFDQFGGVNRFIRKYNNNVTAGMKIDADIDYDWNLNRK